MVELLMLSIAAVIAFSMSNSSSPFCIPDIWKPRSIRRAVWYSGQAKAKRGSANTANVKEPSRPSKKLSGLRQAAYIMKCLDNEEDFEQIIQKFAGDEQLVKLWMSFLLHNRCIENPAIDHKWLITEKGKRWIQKYEWGTGGANIATAYPKSSTILDVE